MSRTELVKRLAETATRPVTEFEAMCQREEQALHQPVADAPAATSPEQETTDLFVWFEDTSGRTDDGRRGTAGLPEALLPWPYDGTNSMRVIDRRYAEGHLHLLSAVRLRCTGKFGERIAAIYTAALSVGTVAWIGTGSQYERAWDELYG